MIDTLIKMFYGYWLLGAVFGLYFVGWGAARLDEEAKTMTPAVRLLLLPGSITLWPLLVWKLVQPHSPSRTDSKPLLP
ncbi:hypothetical protein FHS68_001425 [Dyadobacter arcticus]|uniref:Phospholipase_D-nuclease N-terminal n=1 Tax=Dyadobacter arcticus TaxID=1078754 RepID=A0ABX0UJR8_9BACT|nr:hypothetical protein [Dyadobacter arcticus]